MKKYLTLLLALVGCAPMAWSADIEVESDITENTTWTSDNAYLLGKPIFVTNGATLEIQAGTTIYGYEDFDAGTFGSLVITRGSKIEAAGTAENPIVFTALDARDVELTLEDNQLWGGLIILGNAILNDAGNAIIDPGSTTPPTREVEGFPAQSTDLITYGGDNDDDDSGTLQYVSIRYGGYEFAADNEINGLTLGAVGRGTTIDHVEVYNNSDDGIEFFGGTVDTKYMVMAFNEDESFDIDQGYRGRGQYWFAIQKDVGLGSNYGGEHDGGDSPDKTLEPFATTLVYNATFIGSGRRAGQPQDNSTFRLKDNWAGQYHNSIFADYQGDFVRIDDDTTKAQVNADRLGMFNSTLYNFGAYDGTLASLTRNESVEELLLVSPDRGMTVGNPHFGGVSRKPHGGLDPRPLPGGPAWDGSLSAYPNDGFFDEVDYRGAFGTENWAKGWTHLDEQGFFGAAPVSALTDVEVIEDITEDTVWTNDNAYLLGKPVFVTNGATLYIEAGTTIYGYEDFDAGTFGSLVVTQGAKLFAEGTRELPIVFTALDARDIDLTLEDNQLWGGVILLGNAILNDAGNAIIDPASTTPPTREVEGFPAQSTDLIQYGGADDGDSSGALSYVSIRYGGYEFAADNEINGLTLGAVGEGTEIEYVEVFNNSDDGIEFFGGTVDTRYMVMAFNEDESFDVDQGYRGDNQFWFAIQKDVGLGSNYGGEHDGGDSPDKTLEPYARTTVYNATFIGAGRRAGQPQDNTTFRLKDNWAGQYHNSIFTDFEGDFVRIDDDTTKARVNDGDLGVFNSTLFDFASYDGTRASLTRNESAEELLLVSEARGVLVENPFLGGTSRKHHGGLDPRPLAGGPAWTAPKSAYPANGFFLPVDYRGAFGEHNWAQGWTHLDEKGFFRSAAEGDLTDVEVTEDITEDTVWTNDNAYLLGKPVFVTNGATLYIEAGTTIYGYQDFVEDTFGSLVVTQGAKLFAEGTRELPIVFTALDSRDIELTLEDNQLWGGVILLGNAILNDAGNKITDPGSTTPPTREVEGFPAQSTDLITYGGADDGDSSGALRYVSIRYGGYEFAADNEINGLTLGAVGDGTIIEFVEVFNNSDDGVEFFGGTVDTRYMVMAFNEDESFDIDQGYRGDNQFWFALQKDIGLGSNYGGEHDGGDSPDKTLEPYATTTVYNATWIGTGSESSQPQDNAAFRLKDNWAGQYHNSVFMDFQSDFVRVDDDTTKAQINDGRMGMFNNTLYAFGNYDGTLASLTRNESAEELLLVSEARGNAYADPMLGSVSRGADGGLNPLPASGSPLFTQPLSAYPANGFYLPVSYRGAFGEVNWLKEWTLLDQGGYLAGEQEDTLFFSQYTEGSGFNKAIEIHNPTDETVDLSEYSIQKDVNGNDDFSNELQLSGTLAPGGVVVVSRDDAATEILAVTDILDDGKFVINWNGDDQVRLVHNGTVIDHLGVSGDVTFAQDVTLIREADVTTGDPNPSDPQTSGEWIVLNRDDFTNLGSHPYTPGETYSQFADSVFGSETVNVGPEEDFDGDGLSNLLEFAFASDATVAARGTTLPSMGDEAGPFTFIFTRDADAAVEWTYYLGSDLETLLDAPAVEGTDHTVNVTSNGDGTETVTVTALDTSVEQLFLQIMVTEQ